MMPLEQFARIPARWRKAVLGFAVGCLAVAIIFMTGGQPPQAEFEPRVDTSITAFEITAFEAGAPPEVPPAPKPRPSRAAARPVAAAKPVAAPKSIDAAAAGSPRAAAEPVTTEPVVQAPSLQQKTEAAPAVAKAAQGAPATIVGCLEFDDDRFRLKDTEGENAPRARSWRSGFLRRSNATLNVVDTTNRLPLATHVGHRVSLTGTLAEREMQVRSVKMVADTCDD